MTDIKRILLVNGEFPPIAGGGGIYTSNLAQELAKQNPNIQVLVLAGTRELLLLRWRKIHSPISKLSVLQSYI
jgi:hypothetical protein